MSIYYYKNLSNFLLTFFVLTVSKLACSNTTITFRWELVVAGVVAKTEVEEEVFFSELDDEDFVLLDIFYLYVKKLFLQVPRACFLNLK